ncbi:MAG: ABC transporter ATP-binding protein [SAR202 cluster bacterium]|nr:ABC transporter ATP-binding protein [SAR202 cluster bacterium]
MYGGGFGGGFGGGGMMGGGRMGGGGGSMGGGRFGHLGLDQDEGGKAYDHKVVTRLMRYMRPHMKLVVITFLAMMVYTATVVALPWLTKLVIDDYIRTRDLSGLNMIVAIFIGVAALQFAMSYAHQRLLSYIGQRMLYTIRVQLFSHIQRLSMSFFDRNEVGRVMSRVQNDVQQLQEVLNIVVNSLAQVISLVGIVVVMLVMQWELALITFTVIPLLFIVLIVWQRFALRSFQRARKAIADVNSGLQENISGVRVVQSLNREEANIKRFGKSNTENLDANLEASRVSAILFPTVELLTSLGMALVVLFGGIMVLEGNLEVGVLVAFALYIQRFFEPVRNLTQEYSGLQRAMVSGQRIFEILDITPDVEDKPGAVELPPVKGHIRYEGVGFHYSKDTPVLQEINLEVQPGQTVAFVGPTGAGKTTMVSLLLRLYDVTEGKITIDGHDLRDVTQKSLSRQMSIVPQEPYLFSGASIKDNIRYNREWITDEQIVKAATAVGAHDFVTRLEKGYDTVLQERGSNLSIGQRQLISFARAIVAEPQILILDEATANIDTQSELVIQQALGELLKGRTAVVIAHRLSTIRNADIIVVIDKGRIVEKGRHAELMALNGLYAKLSSFSAVGGDEKPRPQREGREGGRGMRGEGMGGMGGGGRRRLAGEGAD